MPRVRRAAAEVAARATILSVDAADDGHASREAMLGALLARPELRPLLPFARQFYGSPSSYVWVDDAGTTHRVAQAGNKALMPAGTLRPRPTARTRGGAVAAQGRC